ncbi:MAG: SBBP repeat-containing protein [Planctomycetota bacterium]
MRDSRLHLALISALALSSTSTAAAQSSRWLDQFGTRAQDTVRGAAPDGAGGLYLTGWTSGEFDPPGGADQDAWLARFDADGSELWVRQFGGSNADWARDVATDGAGGVYAVGRQETLSNPSLPSALIVRYSGAGQEVWSRRFGWGRDFATAVTSDGVGGAILGVEDVSIPNARLARFDSSGNILWIRSYGPAGDSRFLGLAPDGTGGAFVAGSTVTDVPGQPQPSVSTWVSRADAMGNAIWLRFIGSTDVEAVQDVDADGAGGFFLAGSTVGSFGGPNAGGEDAWVARYDGAGNELWIRQLGSPTTELVRAVSTDSSGGVSVVGATDASFGAPNEGAFDVWVARYTAAGTRTWLRQFGTDTIDQPWAAVPDQEGGVILTGETSSTLGGPNAISATGSSTRDIWIARFDDGFDSERYCGPPIPNVTQDWSLMTVTGSNVASDNDITLRASSLPLNTFGDFLTSPTQGFVAQPAESLGNLCLGGAIGRYVGPGQIGFSGPRGTFELVLDLARTPTPTGLVQVVAGETRNFQAWHRDRVVGQSEPRSNFTDAVSVTFR